MLTDLSCDKIHEYIQNLREKKKATVLSIATATGIAKGTLDNFFAGNTKDPKFINIAAIVDYLGGSLDEMVGLKKPVQDPPHVNQSDVGINAHFQQILEREEKLHAQSIEQIKAMSAEKDQVYQSRYEVLQQGCANARHDAKVMRIACAVLVAALIFLMIDCINPNWGMFTIR